MADDELGSRAHGLNEPHSAISETHDFIPNACTRHPEEKIFARVLDTISHLPLGSLGNSSVLVDLVREAGLARDPRPLYGFGGKEGSEEQWMHKRQNFGMLQMPKQVGCMLGGLAGLSTRVRTFAEIGAWFGWSGLFFAAYIRRVFEASRWAGQDFSSASFDVADMRTGCIKALMARHKHGFHVNYGGGKPKYLPRKPGEKKTRTWRPVLYEDRAKAVAWYHEHLAEAFGPADRETSKLDLCFIDASHTFKHVVEDVRFFQPMCRLLLFHDIVDADSVGVRQLWHFLSSRLRSERDQHAPAGVAGLNGTAWDVEAGYMVKECTQQAGTRRFNFGLGLISAQRLKSSWLDEAEAKASADAAAKASRG